MRMFVGGVSIARERPGEGERVAWTEGVQVSA